MSARASHVMSHLAAHGSSSLEFAGPPQYNRTPWHLPAPTTRMNTLWRARLGMARALCP